MPRFKPVHQGMKPLPVGFARQIQPGSFEYALCYLVDKELDRLPFRIRYNNDETGTPASVPPSSSRSSCSPTAAVPLQPQDRGRQPRECVFIAVSGLPRLWTIAYASRMVMFKRNFFRVRIHQIDRSFFRQGLCDPGTSHCSTPQVVLGQPRWVS